MKNFSKVQQILWVPDKWAPLKLMWMKIWNYKCPAKHKGINILLQPNFNRKRGKKTLICFVFCELWIRYKCFWTQSSVWLLSLKSPQLLPHILMRFQKADSKPFLENWTFMFVNWVAGRCLFIFLFLLSCSILQCSFNWSKHWYGKEEKLIWILIKHWSVISV